MLSEKCKLQTRWNKAVNCMALSVLNLDNTASASHTQYDKDVECLNWWLTQHIHTQWTFRWKRSAHRNISNKIHGHSQTHSHSHTWLVYNCSMRRNWLFKLLLLRQFFFKALLCGWMHLCSQIYFVFRPRILWEIVHFGHSLAGPKTRADRNNFVSPKQREYVCIPSFHSIIVSSS